MKFIVKACALAVVLALGGCADLQPRQYSASPCDAGEASWECQVKRYHDVAQ